MSTLRATFCVSLILLAGCRRSQTGPDANYEKASRIYQQLYAEQLDDAYGDPKMGDVVALLKKVVPTSVDAEAAQHMLDSIESGRALLAKQRADRNKMAAAAAASVASSPQIDPVKILAASAPDAGVADPYGPGAQISTINAATGGCLTEGEPFREQVTGATGTVYRLVKSQQCADRLPGFVGQVVLAADGRIYRRTADPTPQQAPVPLPPRTAPDAGTQQRAAAQPQAPAPAQPPPQPAPAAQANADTGDAGPEMQLYVPGGPIPEGMQQPPPPDQQQQ